jgi:hypothetical protein
LTILLAGLIGPEKEDTVKAALRYATLGFSVIPLRGKVPAVTWRVYQTRRASVGEISRWARRGLFGNVGIVCGAVSGNLVVLDFDAPAAYAAFRARFPMLAASYTVASGGGGRHVYLRADVLPRSRRGQGVELCAEGHQVVAPPSVHPNGTPYRALGPLDVLHVPDLEEVARWVRPAAAKPRPGSSMPAAGVSPSLVMAIAEHFRALGYHQRGDWLNGPCIYPERHAHGDERPSFGFNVQTGYGWCFVCGSMLAKEVSHNLAIFL